MATHPLAMMSTEQHGLLGSSRCRLDNREFLELNSIRSEQLMVVRGIRSLAILEQFNLAVEWA